jgi:hypothetical protein
LTIGAQREVGAVPAGRQGRVKNNRYGLFSNAPAVFATIQVAHVEPSTTGRGLVQLDEQTADAVEKRPNGVRD